MSSFDLVQTALEARLLTLTGLPKIGTAVQVAWENVPFSPTPGSTWLRANFLPGEPARGAIGTGGLSEARGLFQVSVFTAGEAGSGAARRLADVIVSHFKSGTALSSGGLNIMVTRAWRDAGREEPDWYHIPVKVSWYAEPII